MEVCPVAAFAAIPFLREHARQIDRLFAHIPIAPQFLQARQAGKLRIVFELHCRPKSQ